MTYVDRILGEMGQSCAGILARFQRELDVPETRDPQSESYEFIDGYSRLHSKAAEILRDVFKQTDLAVRTVEEWEKREDSRDYQSRWSKKDEQRYGKKLKELSRRCRGKGQQLRRQRDQLEEQRKLAEQRHNNFINYMNLQAARTSSQSAEDVRLFTYVTIIFLPLSFSSSLFSMQGAPQGSVLSIMIPTTIVALAVTVFVLSNMKVVDRNFNFWMYKANANARRKMALSKHSWGFSWNKISRELEEAAQLRAKPENEKHLPAQSKWWYWIFWLSHALKLPRIYVLDGFRTWAIRKDQDVGSIELLFKILLSILLTPTCIFIFIAQMVMVTIADTFELVWKMMHQVKKSIFHRPTSGQMPNKGLKKMMGKPGQDQDAGNIGDEDQNQHVNQRRLSDFSIHSNFASAKFDDTLRVVSEWLQTPPRPIKDFTTRKLDDPNSESGTIEPDLTDSHLKDGPLTGDDDQDTDEDEWDIAIEKISAVGKDRTVKPQRRFALQRRPSNESFKEQPSIWGRWNKKFKDWQRPESKV
ncbi:MAG: hypothetical protein Q9182_000231 [Xanthomendoza sp. 2 TL-2023]